MTRSTHQVGAIAASLAALAFVLPTIDVTTVGVSAFAAVGLTTMAPPVDWQSLVGFFVAALIGGAAPDLDKPRRWWARFLAHTAFGGHRHLSHSFVGLFLAAVASGVVARSLAEPFHLDPGLAVTGFVIGYISHLILDSLTVEGVPWFFPIHRYLGLPPISRMRIRTGGVIERLVVVPLLLASTGWICYRAGGELLSWWSGR